MAISVHRVVCGKWQENCYIITHGEHSTLVIDPGGEAERIMEYIEKKRLCVLAILNTHAHYDHLGAAAALQTELALPFYLHAKDGKLLKYANLYRKLFDGDDAILLPEVNVYFDRVKMPLHLGDFVVDVLFTPGHTPGSVCFLVEKNLFTGDTLLKGKIGRVDLPGGDKTALYNSLKNLSLLPGDIPIYPGHGDMSTLQEEMQDNIQLAGALR
jgi:glyoxylase-like metal-dependent hydrolase (beta-lactamase superfamily II)